MARLPVALCAALVAFLAASPSAQLPDGDVLARVHGYVDKFQRELPSLVAEEHYSQDVAGRFWTGRRTLRSDVLMLTVPGNVGWVSFRDVFEVDGRRIRDREDRLMQLLQSPTPDSMAHAKRLAAESARYNVGRVTRTTNLPDSALVYLQAASAPRMKFEAPRRASPVDGLETVVIRFRETGRPTVVLSPRGTNVPASGQVWAHAATGAIVKTEFTLSDLASEAVFTVEFAIDERLGLRLPAKMIERNTSPGEQLRATAQYSNFRRFGVATSEKVGKPPGR